MAKTVSFQGKRELRWLMVGECLVTYMEAEFEFADALWDEWMEVIQRPSTASVMLCSWGPTQPSHQQWRRLTRLMRERELPVAVVTEARHNLALAKAASWLGTNIESHRWSGLRAAVKFLGLDEQFLVLKVQATALRDCFGAVLPAAERFAGAPLTHTARAPRMESMSDMGSMSVASSPMSASSAVVSEHSEEIQKRLAQIQARLAASRG